MVSHGIREGTGDVQENDGDDFFPAPGIFDIVDQVEERVGHCVAREPPEALWWEEGVTYGEVYQDIRYDSGNDFPHRVIECYGSVGFHDGVVLLNVITLGER